MARRDKSNRHKRFYPKKTDRVDLSKFNVKSGMIVEFPYKTSERTTRPLVFVMDTEENSQGKKKKFSGLNLNYLPISEIEKFFTQMLSIADFEIDRHTDCPKVIYDKLVKKSILPKYPCWRSYSYHRITDIYQIRFHFTTPPRNLIYEGSKRLGRANENEIKRILNTVNKK